MKRSFFSKLAVAPSQSVQKTEEDATDLFRQSSNVYSSIVAERERKLKERKERKARAKGKVEENSDEDWEGSGAKKKRRISLEDEDEDAHDVKPQTTPTKRTRSQTNTPTNVKQSPRDLSARYNDAMAAAKDASKQTDIVDLGGSSSEPEPDDDDLYVPPKPRLTPQKDKSNKVIELDEAGTDNMDPEEREYLELIERAKERMRLEELKQAKGKPASSSSTIQQTVPAAPNPIDPPVSIMVTSDIEGVKPLVVRILLSKRIKDVRVAWCGYNQLPEDQSAAVFMTWRGLKQWDITTLKRMMDSVVDISVNEDGTFSCVGRGDGITEDYSKIHLVATTQELFDEAKRSEEKKLQEPTEEEVDANVLESLDDIPKTNDLIPILLKENGDYGELKIKVKPHTTFERLVAAFVRAKGVPPEKNVFLMYEGEKLNPDDEMKDSEIEERDVVEVYVR